LGGMLAEHLGEGETPRGRPSASAALAAELAVAVRSVRIERLRPGRVVEDELAALIARTTRW